MPVEYRGWRIYHPNVNEEPAGVWWANGQIEHVAGGALEPVALSEHFSARDDALHAYLRAARARIAAKP